MAKKKKSLKARSDYHITVAARTIAAKGDRLCEHCKAEMPRGTFYYKLTRDGMFYGVINERRICRTCFELLHSLIGF